MGIDSDFGRAYAKSQIAAGQILPVKGERFYQCAKSGQGLYLYCQKLFDLGFSLLATSGTAKVLANNGLTVKSVLKITEEDPTLPTMKNGTIAPTSTRHRKGRLILINSADKPCRDVHGAVLLLSPRASAAANGY